MVQANPPDYPSLVCRHTFMLKLLAAVKADINMT
jgi:hypothetical protein